MKTKKAFKVKCSDDCELCGGDGFIVTGLKPQFNISFMAFDLIDEKEPCPNATIEENNHE